MSRLLWFSVYNCFAFYMYMGLTVWNGLLSVVCNNSLLLNTFWWRLRTELNAFRLHCDRVAT